MQKFKILFEDFLNNKKVYGLNQTFWKKAFQKSIEQNKIKQENWYTNQYANGTKIYDGNPIYSLLINSQKSIRIIQEEPESEIPEISAWIHKTEDEHQNALDELVISLELSNLTKKVALEFVSDWVKEDTNSEVMKELIDVKLGVLQNDI